MIDNEKKSQIISKYARHEGDTGSVEVQVALLTDRISSLTDHLKIHKKDYHSRRGLFCMIGHRRNLLNYLKRCDFLRYSKLIDDLGIRSGSSSASVVVRG